MQICLDDEHTRCTNYLWAVFITLSKMGMFCSSCDSDVDEKQDVWGTSRQHAEFIAQCTL
jgi:hypothetical protein